MRRRGETARLFQKNISNRAIAPPPRRQIWYNVRMETILFFQSTLRKSWRQKLAGAHAFAREHDWLVQSVNRFATTDEIRGVLEEWTPAGCMVDRGMANSAAPDHLFAAVPTVYLDQTPDHPSRIHPCLLHDSAAEAAAAAAELLARNCASYAYIGTGENLYWDRVRRERFAQAIQCETGKTVSVLPGKRLREALEALPKPCGILGANDECAIKAYHAAVAAGLAIPDDVMLAGIDNDEIYCEAVDPGLTSVEPDFEGAGYRLAQMLHEEISRFRRHGARRRGAPPTDTYGPLRIVQRGSTAAQADIGPRVRRALEYIRRHACEPSIGLDGVISAMDCSRRLATLLFKKELKRTILGEIHRQRFLRACDLLERTDMPISTVIVHCGYRSDSFVKKLFMRETGMTMRDYRRRRRASRLPPS